jgi:hypothetical protein
LTVEVTLIGLFPPGVSPPDFLAALTSPQLNTSGSEKIDSRHPHDIQAHSDTISNYRPGFCGDAFAACRVGLPIFNVLFCRFGLPPVATHGLGLPTQAWGTGAVPDPEIAQCFKRLSKRDVSTKLKALRCLPDTVRAGGPEIAAELLPSWLFVFKRLVMDNNRAVRHASIQAFDAIATTCGRKIAPNLKSVMGPWWFAMSDPYKEASAAASAVFEV